MTSLLNGYADKLRKNTDNVMIQLIFYSLAAILVFAAVRVISVRNPVHAALFLVLAFFSSAAIWLLLEAEFLAIVLVLVYVGAVMVLFLFVVMMLDINTDAVKEGFARYLPVGILVALLILAEMTLVVGSSYFNKEASLTTSSLIENAIAPEAVSNTVALGRVLYTDYLYPFEIAAIILLVAMVAAITLTMRRRRGTKHQKPEQQVKVKSNERVHLIKMNSEID